MVRLDNVFDTTAEAGIVQLVDAEQTYFQAAIDVISLFYMKKYVMSDRPQI